MHFSTQVFANPATDGGGTRVQEFCSPQNSKIKKEKDTELHALLQYLCKKQATSTFTKTIDELVETTKNNERFRSLYMSLNIHKDDLLREGSQIGEKIGFEKGIAAGMRKGRQDGIVRGAYQKALETAKILKQLGDPIQKITQATGLTKEEVESV